jgi:hypothetical protein
MLVIWMEQVNAANGTAMGEAIKEQVKITEEYMSDKFCT